MQISPATTPKKAWAARAGIGAAAAFALVIGGIAVSANADSAFAPYHENDNALPLSVTEGLVFFKNADLGWVVNTPIADIESLAYTVSGGADALGSGVAVHNAPAPSFQLITSSTQFAYARLVWEPYMQGTGLDGVKGEYTNLQDGLWWTNKIANPNPGSQASPQPLSFFESHWTNIVVGAIDIHQGSTTDATSVVTKVTFNGADVPLGNADTTRFTQADIDDAVDNATSPLNDEISDLTSDKNGLTQDLADANDQIADLQHDLNAANAALAAATAPLGTQIANLQSQLTTAQQALAAYKANHHTADGSSIGESRAVLATTIAHGKTVGVTLKGTIGTKATALKYQWYLGGHVVPGATKATYKIPASAKGKSVSVKVTGTYKNIVFAIHSNTVAAK